MKAEHYHIQQGRFTQYLFEVHVYDTMFFCHYFKKGDNFGDYLFLSLTRKPFQTET